MSWKALITDAGNELSAKTISGGNIKLTHAKAGSGTVSEEDLHLQTELVNVKQTLSIESIKYSNTVNNIEILLDCRGLKEAYDLTQIGIYATDPDAGEILFAIAQTENPKHIPAENEVPFYSIDFNFAFALKNNQNMVATIDQSTFATKEQLSAVDARIDNIIVNAGSTEDNAELIDMRVDVDGKRHSTAGEALRSQLKQKANLTDISSPYQFRGACLSANLPGSGNKINDTYYVTDKKCKFTWNGAAWYQSSLNESDYEEELSSLTKDLDYKQNMGLVPAQFETILGYYKGTEFVEGQRAWGARIARVLVQSGEKYRYMYSTDSPTVVTFLDDEKNVISQITVARNTSGVMDVHIPNGATYADFYNAFNSRKFECLRYSNSSKLESMIFSDDIGSFEVISNRYFSPSRDDLLIGNNQQLYSYIATESSIFRISFIQHQPFTVYVDDFCCVDRNDYVNGTEVYRENCIVYVPKGKTLRINSYISSNEEKTKIEKYIEISEKYINEKIPEIEEVVDVVSKDLENPVSSKGVYNAIQTNGVNASTGLPFVAVASSEAPGTIKSVCQFVCDGTDDNVEIQNAINSLASTGGRVFLTKGKFFISAPVDTGNTLIELCGEGTLLDLREDTVSSSTRGGTILQAVGNTDLLHIGGAKGTTVHDIAFFGYGRNKPNNTSFGIRFTGYADTDRIYNCGFTNCSVAIGSDIATDVVYIYNLSVQRNKIGIMLYHTNAEIHDCLFCENIGAETVVWDNTEYSINCADICVKNGGSKIYNNTFRRSGMCYDIYNVYGNESKLESDVVNPISSVVLLGVAKILSNYFYDQIYANCVRVMSKPDFIYIEGNSFTKWGRTELEDESKKAAICFEKGSVFGTVMNNRFYSDSNTDKFTDKYALYEVSIGSDNNYWSYSNTYANNFIGNLTGETDNKCVIVGTSVNNKFINNIIAEKYKDTAVVN